MAREGWESPSFTSGRGEVKSFAVISGGLVTVAGALVIGAALPAFRRYRWEPGAAAEQRPHVTAAET